MIVFPSFSEILVKCSPSFIDLNPSIDASENSLFFQIFSTVNSCEYINKYAPQNKIDKIKFDFICCI